MRSFFLLICITMLAGTAFAEVPTESIGKVEVLPLPYPNGLIIAADFSMNHPAEGRLVFLDINGKTQPEQFRGLLNISLIGFLTIGKERDELYVAETFYSRGRRGDRTDVVTIYDKSTLQPIDEIVIPSKRFLGVPNRHNMELDESGRYLLVFNLTPATSVSVIDVIDRKFIGEIDTPGCSFIFPTGRAGFSSICADGSMMSIQLNPQGLVASRETTESFFDVETDPLFAEAALVDNFGYFPTFGGDIQEVDLSDSIAKPGLKWPLTQSDGSDSGWRPGGLQLIDSDSKGNIYVLMHPRGDSSSHKDGGKEVWIFDRESRKRISKLELQTWSISLSVVGEAGSEYLVTSNVRKNLDVYDLQTLEYVKSMERFAQDTPLIIVYNPH